jgi:hypothetical protein
MVSPEHFGEHSSVFVFDFAFDVFNFVGEAICIDRQTGSRKCLKGEIQVPVVGSIVNLCLQIDFTIDVQTLQQLPLVGMEQCLCDLIVDR